MGETRRPHATGRGPPGDSATPEGNGATRRFAPGRAAVGTTASRPVAIRVAAAGGQGPAHGWSRGSPQRPARPGRPSGAPRARAARAPGGSNACPGGTGRPGTGQAPSHRTWVPPPGPGSGGSRGWSVGSRKKSTGTCHRWRSFCGFTCEGDRRPSPTKTAGGSRQKVNQANGYFSQLETPSSRPPCPSLPGAPRGNGTHPGFLPAHAEARRRGIHGDL